MAIRESWHMTAEAVTATVVALKLWQCRRRRQEPFIKDVRKMLGRLDPLPPLACILGLIYSNKSTHPPLLCLLLATPLLGADILYGWHATSILSLCLVWRRRGGGLRACPPRWMIARTDNGAVTPARPLPRSMSDSPHSAYEKPSAISFLLYQPICVLRDHS